VLIIILQISQIINETGGFMKGKVEFSEEFAFKYFTVKTECKMLFSAFCYKESNHFLELMHFLH